MAKLPNLWLKGGSQKLGGVVLYQAKGQTLARELAPSVANPRTDSQMTQRIKLANVVGMYRANRTWMAGAFEDKKQTESDYNAFVKANLANSLVATSKAQAAAGATVVAPYKVTSGSLPSIANTLDGTEIVTDLFVGDLAIVQSTSVAQLSAALINNNNGIREGMQLSLIINLQQVSPETGIPYVIVRAYEMIINLTDSRLLTDFFADVVITSSIGDNPSLALGVSGIGAGAACFILSQTSGGKTRVSTQSLVMFGQNEIYLEYTSQAAINTAVRSYGENTSVFLDSNTAEGAQAVPTVNYISALRYKNVLYQAYQSIYGGIEAGSNIDLYFNQPLSTNFVLTIYDIGQGSSAALAHSAVTVAEGRQQITFSLSSDYEPTENKTLRFNLVDGSNTIYFDVRITSGDIS